MKAKRFILMLLITLGSVTGAWAQYDAVVKYKASQKLNRINLDDVFVYHFFDDEVGSSFKVVHEYDVKTQEGTISFKGGQPTEIKTRAFFTCYELISITLPSSIHTIGESAFLGCSALESISLSSGLATINMFAFADTKLKDVVLPSSLTSLEMNAFTDCTELESVEIQGNLQSIPAYAFKNCTKLTTVILPPGLESIGVYAFEGCTSLTSLDFLPAGLKEIESLAFAECTGLISGSLPAGVTTIPTGCFKGCTSLTSFTLSNSITSIGKSAFEDCTSITSLSLPDKIRTIQDNTFKNCSNLSSITLSTDVTSIGASAFEGCAKLAAFALPTAMKTISQSTFKGCKALTQFTFHSAITSIGASALEGCTGLTEIWADPDTPPTVGSNAFNGVNKSIPVHIPEKTKGQYLTAAGWRDFTNFVTPRITLDLADATAFTAENIMLYDELTYTRNFSAAKVGKWQSLFVPFDIEITEEVLEKCDIAKPYMVATEGAIGGGTSEGEGADVLVLKKLKQGDTTLHGTPYFIRPKAEGELSLTMEDILVYTPTDVNTLTCSTTEDDYAFVGLYAEGKPAAGTIWYAINGEGSLQRGDDSSYDLPAQRWYMTKTSKNGMPAPALARAMRITTLGEEDIDDTTTAIVEMTNPHTTNPTNIYSLSGVRLTQPHKGVNITNGKKVIIK